MAKTTAARQDQQNQRPGMWRLLPVLSLGILVAGAAWASDTTEYEYDALGRLIKVVRSGGEDTTYDYDPAGNRESKTVGDAQSPSNNPPVAVNDFTTAPGRYIPFYMYPLGNDSDPDGDSLTIIAVTQPPYGSVIISTPTSLRITGYSIGSATFTYTISDGNGGTDTASITLIVPS